MDWFAWYLVGFRQLEKAQSIKCQHVPIVPERTFKSHTVFSFLILMTYLWFVWSKLQKDRIPPFLSELYDISTLFFTFTWLVRHQRGKFCIALWWNDDKGSLNPWIPYSLIHNFTRGAVGRLFICSKRRITSLIVLHFLSSAPQAYAHLQHTARLFRKMLKLGCKGYISEASLMWNQKPMSSREADAVSFHHKL